MTDDALPKQYDHNAAQERWYSFWEKSGYFHSEPDPDREPYTIVIPPPNVTGALHLGHALNNTLQDIMIRMKRMQGFNTLWMPGMDHAGIATQAVVERRLLEEEKLSRHDLGREKLVERIWQWKEEYEKRIIGQLKQLGCSCDWERLRFTLDDQCARAVRQTFFSLFQDGKIYRGKRLVNWDTFLQTTVSDDEVFHETVQGHFWHFRYPVIDPQPGEPKFVTIATTRPETMLGDTAVAVHPEPAAALDRAESELRDKLASTPEKEREAVEAQIEAIAVRRQAKLPELIQLRDMAAAGRKLELPLTGRQIPLIADDWAKPELGSGCVKITPAHDENDYQVGQRNTQIGAINIMNTDGTLNDSVPEKYRGLKMKKARAAVVDDLAELGLHDPETDREDREIDLAHSDRSKTPIEPYLADQWFVKMDELAQTAMDAVTDDRVKIYPPRYAKGYLDWLSEKRDWPIGRQLWWGHRIPVWSASTAIGAFSRTEPNDEDLARQEAAQQQLDEFFREANVPAEDYNVRFPDGWHLYICMRTDHADDALKFLAQERNLGENQDDSLVEQFAGDFTNARSAAHRVTDIHWLKQEDDVLDTWFSSALWPHSTLGWPEKTAELEYYYPTSTLITSRDIITLWVARMVLTGLHNMGEVPFREVFIHPKILDGYGETMSKSKGNGVDPLDVIDKFGADALRFGIAYLTTETQDVRMPVEFECPNCQALIKQTKKNRTLPRIECDKCHQPFGTQWAQSHGTDEDRALPRGAVVSERFELGRNFCNKLWNVSRLALMNFGDYTPGPVADDDLAIEDRWILSRLSTITGEVTEALERYRFAEAASALYKFAWDEFCSFYAEMAKRRWDEPTTRVVAQRVFAHTLDVLLRLLHPMIPFLTEEVWQRLSEVAAERGLGEPQPAAESVMIADWPVADETHQDATIEQRFARFQAVLGAVREIRSRQSIPPRETIEFSVKCDAATTDLLRPMEPYFASMAQAEAVAWGADVEPPVTAGALKNLGDIEVYVDLSGFIDIAAEIARNEKLAADLAGHISGKAKKLENENFVSRAPAEVVEKERESLVQLKQQLTSVEATLDDLRSQA